MRPLARLAVCLALAALLAACGEPAQAPVSIVVGRVATATGLATLTEPPGAELTTTATPSATLRPLTPTVSGLRTKTPLPGSPSPSPSATRRPGGGGAAATSTPTPAASGANGGSLDTRAHGVTGTLRMEAAERVYQRNEQMWFSWTVTNLTAADLNYGHIGVVQSAGGFHTSWSGSALRPRTTANWRDWVSFAAPGEYTLVLAICLSSAAECEGGGQWVDLTAPLAVTVQ
jgi:hypothetical protein